MQDKIPWLSSKKVLGMKYARVLVSNFNYFRIALRAFGQYIVFNISLDQNLFFDL